MAYPVLRIFVETRPAQFGRLALSTEGKGLFADRKQASAETSR